MDEQEVEFVAEELAKVGGLDWHQGRQEGPIARVVTERYRDRARVAIAAVERYRSVKRLRPTPTSPVFSNLDEVAAMPGIASVLSRSEVEVGAVVVYRPPGDRRAYACMVDRIEGDSAVLTPITVSSFRVPLGPAEDVPA